MRSLTGTQKRRLAEFLSPVEYLQQREIVHPTKGRVPWKLYPYQKDILRSDAQRLLIVKARETGISQVVTGLALWRAKYTPERSQVFISRNRDEARKLVDYVRVLASTDSDLGDLEGVVLMQIPSYGRDLLEARTAGGNRLHHNIVAEAASMSAGRGGGKLHLYLDEAAHGNFRVWGSQIWNSVQPGISLGGGVTVISTPKGKTNIFFRLYQEAILGITDFKIIKIRWFDCPAFNPKGWHLEDEDARRKVGEKGEWFLLNRGRYDDASWAEEYDCDFTASAGLVYGQFDAAVHVGSYKWQPGWRMFVTQDFGYINPAVALLIQVSPSDDIFVLAEMYHTQIAFSTLVSDYYLPWWKEYSPEVWCCDVSGANEIAELEKAGIDVFAKASSVPDGIAETRKLFRPALAPPKIHVDRSCRRLIADLSTYSYKPDSDEPEEINDHGPDALRYFVSMLLNIPLAPDHIPTAGKREIDATSESVTVVGNTSESDPLWQPRQTGDRDNWRARI